MAVITGSVVAAGSLAASVKAGQDAKSDASKGRKLQAAENAASRAAIQKGQQTARGDVERLMPEAQVLRGLGAQSAIDIFGSSMPAQYGAFQQGNIGAQEAILSGLQQQNNAIMGNPTDFSGLQPHWQQPDFSFLPNQIPQGMIGSLLQGYGGEVEYKDPNRPEFSPAMGPAHSSYNRPPPGFMDADLAAQREQQVMAEEAAIAQKQAQAAAQFHRPAQTSIPNAFSGTIPLNPLGG